MDLREQFAKLLGLKKAPDGEGLEGFSDEQLDQAKAASFDSFSEAKEANDADAAKAAHAVFMAAKNEIAARAEAAASTAAEMAALEADFAAEAEASTDGDGADDGSGDGDGGDGDGDGNSDGTDGDDGSDGSGEPAGTPDPQVGEQVTTPPVTATPEPVLAAAPAPAAPAKPTAAPKARPTPPSSGKPKPVTNPVKLTASGDVKGHSAGADMDSSKLGEAFAGKSGAILSAKDGSRKGIATLDWSDQYSSDRFLSDRDSIDVNTEKVNKVVEMAQDITRQVLSDLVGTSGNSKEVQALMAAGGLCAPVNVRYDIFTVGSTRRPLRDSLTRFGASRGGIRFNRPPVLTDVDGAVNIYTEAQDTAGTSYPKGCIRVDCGDDVEVAVDAIPLCMIVGNYQRLFFPENFRAWWQLGRVAHSRTAEDKLWDQLVSDGVDVTAGEGLGAARDIISQVIRAATQYRDRHRIDPETPIRLHTQSWVRDLMKVDLIRQQPGDNTITVSNADIARMFAVHNLAVTFILDGIAAGGTSGYPQAAGALNPWPTNVEFILSVDGTLLFLDGGTLDFGTQIEDFTQIRQNDSGAFMETFESYANVGPDFEHITINVCPDGTTAGTDDNFNPCTTGS